jgi:hypothetical protein
MVLRFYDKCCIFFAPPKSKLKQRVVVSLPQMRTMKINEYDEMKAVSINYPPG